MTRPVVNRSAPGGDVMERLSGLDPILARLYATRGVTDPVEVEYGLDRLAPVGTLDNVDAAVDLLLESRDQRVVVVGR